MRASRNRRTAPGVHDMFEPSATAIIPGMLLLLPGGLGFRSLSALLAADVVSGIQSGFTMLLIALSLVTGLMLASITSRSYARF